MTLSWRDVPGVETPGTSSAGSPLGAYCRSPFTLLPPAEDDPNGETVIFLLRLLHSPQLLTAANDTPL